MGLAGKISFFNRKRVHISGFLPLHLPRMSLIAESTGSLRTTLGPSPGRVTAWSEKMAGTSTQGDTAYTSSSSVPKVLLLRVELLFQWLTSW